MSQPVFFRTSPVLLAALVLALRAFDEGADHGRPDNRFGPPLGRRAPGCPTRSDCADRRHTVLRHLRALYRVLTSDAPESALLVVAAGGQAELALLSDRFVDALLSVRDAYISNNDQVL